MFCLPIGQLLKSLLSMEGFNGISLADYADMARGASASGNFSQQDVEMLLKARLPIFVTVAGMLISEMVELIKALSPIDFRPIGSVTLFTFLP